MVKKKGAPTSKECQKFLCVVKKAIKTCPGVPISVVRHVLHDEGFRRSLLDGIATACQEKNFDDEFKADIETMSDETLRRHSISSETTEYSRRMFRAEIDRRMAINERKQEIRHLVLNMKAAPSWKIALRMLEASDFESGQTNPLEFFLSRKPGSAREAEDLIRARFISESTTDEFVVAARRLVPHLRSRGSRDVGHLDDVRARLVRIMESSQRDEIAFLKMFRNVLNIVFALSSDEVFDMFDQTIPKRPIPMVALRNDTVRALLDVSKLCDEDSMATPAEYKDHIRSVCIARVDAIVAASDERSKDYIFDQDVLIEMTSITRRNLIV